MKLKNIIKWFFIGLGGFLLVVFLLYFINNYNKFKIYTFTGGNSKYGVSGNATFSGQFNVLNITGIHYGYTDISIKSINVDVYAKLDEKEILIFGTGTKSGKGLSLKDYLDEFSYSVSEKNGYDELFNSDVINKFDECIYLRISYVDENNENFTEEIKLESKLYSNTSFFYKKAPKI